MSVVRIHSTSPYIRACSSRVRIPYRPSLGASAGVRGDWVSGGSNPLRSIMNFGLFRGFATRRGVVSLIAKASVPDERWRGMYAPPDRMQKTGLAEASAARRRSNRRVDTTARALVEVQPEATIGIGDIAQRESGSMASSRSGVQISLSPP